MKKFFVLTLAAASVAGLTACNFHNTMAWDGANLTAATNIVQSGAFPAGMRVLEVNNRNGNVHIVGTDDSSAKWSWNLIVHAETLTAAARFATNTTCKAELVGERYTLVITTPSSFDAHSVESDFEIALPKSVAARIHNNFGQVEISGLNADADVANENGRVEIKNVGGIVHAQTSFDSLSVSNTGLAVLKNQNGDITASKVASSLEASTSFASLIVRDIMGPATLANQNGRIEATSVHGALAANTSFDSLVATDIFGAVRLRDQNGSVRVADIEGDARVETSFDTVDVARIRGNADLANQNGAVTVHGVSGAVMASTSFAPIDIWGEGSQFVCHNQNGAIRLHAASSALAKIEAKTCFDSIEVYLPADLKPAIEARTSFADVESDFPVLSKRAGTDAFADLGPDVARISLNNQNGGIRIARN